MTDVIKASTPTELGFAFQFAPRKPDGDADFELRIAEPADVFASGFALDPQALLQDPPREGAERLTVLWVAEGSASSISEAQRDAWLAAALNHDFPKPLRASMRGTRITFGPARALITGPHDVLNDALDALLRFAQVEGALQKLEHDVHGNWDAVAEDSPLLHEPGAIARERRPSVATRMQEAAGMKASFLRISLAAEQLDPRLTDASKRLFGELANAAAIYDRIEMLDDPVQFMLDHYEIILTRKDEMGARNEENHAAFWSHALEVVIILVLLYQAFFTHHA